MKKYKIAFSNTAPEASDVLWAQPIGDGFTLRLCMRGEWKPIKLADTTNTSFPYDDELIGGSDIAEMIEQGGNGGIKSFKVICDSRLNIMSLGYNGDNQMLYTAAQFGPEVSEEVRQQVLEGIETNKTFANFVLEAINNGEPICINRVYPHGTNPYTGHNTVFASYSFGYVDVGANGVQNPNAIILGDPSNRNNTIIAIPAAISEDNTKYVLRDYTAYIGEK